MERETKMTVCSGCIEEFPSDDLFTVTRYMNRSKPEKTNIYSTPYCEDCIKTDKENYINIKLQPNRVIKEKAKEERKKATILRNEKKKLDLKKKKLDLKKKKNAKK